MNTDFFAWNNYFVDERVNFFKFENEYKVYNSAGTQIGSVHQRLSLGAKILRMLMNNRMLPFYLEIQDANGRKLASLSRGWTFLMSRITVSNAQDITIGYINQQFKFFTPAFSILNAGEQEIAKITGDWTAWDFVITDNQGREIGSITKKWAGMMKELFTTADKYNVNINPDYQMKEYRPLLLSCAITIDMVFKEQDR